MVWMLDGMWEDIISLLGLPNLISSWSQIHWFKNLLEFSHMVMGMMAPFGGMAVKAIILWRTFAAIHPPPMSGNSVCNAIMSNLKEAASQWLPSYAYLPSPYLFPYSKTQCGFMWPMTLWLHLGISVCLLLIHVA
jgi:hypothetical protein